MAFVNTSWCPTMPVRAFSSHVSMKCAWGNTAYRPRGWKSRAGGQNISLKPGHQSDSHGLWNCHLITTLSPFPTSHLGNTQLSLERLCFQGSKQNTTHLFHIAYLNKEYWEWVIWLFLNSMIKKTNSHYCQAEQKSHRSNCIHTLLLILYMLTEWPHSSRGLFSGDSILHKNAVP